VEHSLITDAPTVEQALAAFTGEAVSVTAERPVGGGCIANAARLETTHGPFFSKRSSSLPAAMFTVEAEGLAALACPGGPRVPRPVAVWTGAGEAFLLMEWIESARPGAGFHRRFGRELATLHRERRGDAFGLAHDNFIGSTPQPNTQEATWCAFFAEHRLGYQLQLAVDRSRLGSGTARSIESIMSRTSDLLVEPEHPSLLHGDLWGGNYMCDTEGRAVLIDPAVYYGHPEADLAMTELFGGFRPEFYSGYSEVSPIDRGYRERRDLYNLYHMLNHLNIFGGGYRGSVESIVARYS
jgi:fructosamine-3-kinase